MNALVVVLLAACGDAAEVADAPACAVARQWTIDNLRDAAPVERHWEPITDSAERLCYPTESGGECQRVDGTTLVWSDASLAPERTVIVGDTSGVYRVLQLQAGTVVRGDGGDDTIDCDLLLGAYASDGCVGVIADRCGPAWELGPQLHVRDADGEWEPPVALPAPVPYPRALSITAAGCDAWHGVWTSDSPGLAAGPNILTFVADRFSEQMLGDDHVVRAFVDPTSGDVVALDRDGDLIWYREDGAPEIIAEPVFHRVSDDLFLEGRLAFAATSPLDTLAVSEDSGSPSSGLVVLSRVDGAWQRSAFVPDAHVWSMARSPTGDVVIDMRVGQAPGHMRLRGTCASFE